MPKLICYKLVIDFFHVAINQNLFITFTTKRKTRLPSNAKPKYTPLTILMVDVHFFYSIATIIAEFSIPL